MATYLWALVLIGGMAVGDSGAKATVEDVPAPPSPADIQLEKAARNCRIQIYETFHKDRAEYDRRQAEAALVQRAWTDAGRNEKEQPLLIHWLEVATAGSRAGSTLGLPPAPKFTPMPKTEEPEEQMVETDDKPAAAAASGGDVLHVTPAGATSIAKPKPAPGTSPATAESSKKGVDAGILPQSKLHYKPSVICSLPNMLEAEIGRALHSLSSKPAPKTVPSAGPKAAPAAAIVTPAAAPSAPK